MTLARTMKKWIIAIILSTAFLTMICIGVFFIFDIIQENQRQMEVFIKMQNMRLKPA